MRNLLYTLLALTLVNCSHSGYIVKFNGVNIEEPTLVTVVEGAVTLTGTAPDNLKPRDYHLLNLCKELRVPCYEETELLWKGHNSK